MKTFFLLIATATIALCAPGDYSIDENMTVRIEDRYGNKVVAGNIADHAKINPAKMQAACDAHIMEKFSKDKKKAVKDAVVIKAAGLTVPANIKDDAEDWIVNDANDAEKVKSLPEVVKPAEEIGCTIPQETKDKIDAAKQKP